MQTSVLYDLANSVCTLHKEMMRLQTSNSLSGLLLSGQAGVRHAQGF